MQGQFADPNAVRLFRQDLAGWSEITGSANPSSFTVCGYTAVLGTFAVAEFGASPTALATETATDVPTETPTSTSAATNLPTNFADRNVAPYPYCNGHPLGDLNRDCNSHEYARTVRHIDSNQYFNSDRGAYRHSACYLDLDSNYYCNAHRNNNTAPTFTGTTTSSPTPTSSPTITTTFTPTPTPATGQLQFALPNVWVTYSENPSSGGTQGSVLDGSALPSLPPSYRVASAWFFSISITVNLNTNKKVCVLFEAIASSILRPLNCFARSGSNWTPMIRRVLTDLDDTQGTVCGYTPLDNVGSFVLAERLPSTATPTPNIEPHGRSLIDPVQHGHNRPNLDLDPVGDPQFDTDLDSHRNGQQRPIATADHVSITDADPGHICVGHPNPDSNLIVVTESNRDRNTDIYGNAHLNAHRDQHRDPRCWQLSHGIGASNDHASQPAHWPHHLLG